MSGTTIGLDIGTTSVRAVQAGVRRGTPRIVKAGEIKLPQGAMVNGELRDPEVVTAAVRRLWRRARFQSRGVVIGMANQQTFLRLVEVMSDSDKQYLLDALPERLEEEISTPVEDVVFDAYPLGEFLDAKGNLQTQTYVAGALTGAVENLYEAVWEGKLRPERLDHLGFALIRSAAFTQGLPRSVPAPPPPGEEFSCQAVVDIGAQSTIVAVHDRGRPLMMRVVPGGGESVTRAIQDHVEISFDVAENIKKHLGLGGVASSEVVFPEDDKELQDLDASAISVAQQILNLMAGSIIQGVRETIDFYLASSPDVTGVEKISLSGGGAALRGIDERLAAELRTDVDYLNVLERFTRGKRKSARWAEHDPRFGVAFGLAMGVK